MTEICTSVCYSVNLVEVNKGFNGYKLVGKLLNKATVCLHT